MEEIIQEALNKGVELHVAGEFDLASQLYESVIKLQPDHADANHNMGVLKLTTGNDLEALSYLQKALQADMSIAQFWLSYTKALIKLERKDEATRILDLARENGLEGEEFVELRQLLTDPNENKSVTETEGDVPRQTKPNIVDTLKLDGALKLAKKQMQEGAIEEAKLIYQDILSKFPKNVKAQKGLNAADKKVALVGSRCPPQEIINQLITLYNKGQLAEAVGYAQEIIEKYPDAFMAWNILGMACKGLGKCDEAIQAFTKATELNPGFADGYSNLGVAFEDQGKQEQAIEAYNKAVKINPDHAQSYYNMGNVLKSQGNLDEAVKSYRSAIRVKPDYVEAMNNMGLALEDQGHLDDAIAAYKKAISIKPNYADAHYNLGRLYWSMENLNEAFKLMEWRWHSKKQFIGTHLNSTKPTWIGECNHKVFVWKEQGIGDEILFSSIFSELNAKSEKLIIECDKRLIPIYRRSFPGDIEFTEDRNLICQENYDSHIAIGSLPRYFRNKLSDFKSTSRGWLKADPEKTKRITKQFKDDQRRPIIGISWYTRSSRSTAKRRNIPLDLLAKNLAKIRANYVNLQYGDTAEELTRLRCEQNFIIFDIEGIDLFHDIDGLAALLLACDVIISVDNVTVHLAGALGVDTRVLLPSKADERWGFSRTDSYWYESVNLYRQNSDGDWLAPLNNLSEDLLNLHF